MKDNQIETIKKYILPELEEGDMELVDLELKGRVGRQHLRIFVDKPNGVTMDDCADLSRRISDVLDIKDPIAGRYTLEISSPGLDRPLRSARDFRRRLGEQVRITYQIGGKVLSIEGTLGRVSEHAVEVNANGMTKEIAIDSIKKAKVALPW